MTTKKTVLLKKTVMTVGGAEMPRARFVLSLLVLFAMSACSASRKGGAGDASDADGSIPLARGSSEIADVSFAFDSSALSSTGQSTLRDGAKWLQANGGKNVQIEGHCDERGTNEYNLALGERRARAAHDYLRSLGVKKERMSTISYGEELPLDAGHSEDAWAKNRRAHFAIK